MTTPRYRFSASRRAARRWMFSSRLTTDKNTSICYINRLRNPRSISYHGGNVFWSFHDNHRLNFRNHPLCIILLSSLGPSEYESRRVKSGACNAPLFLLYGYFFLPSFTQEWSSGKANLFQFPFQPSDSPGSSFLKVFGHLLAARTLPWRRKIDHFMCEPLHLSSGLRAHWSGLVANGPELQD